MEDNYISTYKDEVEDITTIEMSGPLHFIATIEERGPLDYYYYRDEDRTQYYQESSRKGFLNIKLCRIISKDTDALFFLVMSSDFSDSSRLVFRINDSKVISLESEQADIARYRFFRCIPFRITIEQFRDICSANKVIYKISYMRHNLFFGKSKWDMLLEYCRVFYNQAYEFNTFPNASSDYEKKIDNIINSVLKEVRLTIDTEIDTGKLDIIPNVIRDFINEKEYFNGVEVERFIEKLKKSIERSKNKSTKSNTKQLKSTTSEQQDEHIVVTKVWVDTDGVGQLLVHCDWVAKNMKGSNLEFRVNLEAKSGVKVKFDASVNQWYYLLEKFRPQNDSHQFKNTCCAIPSTDFNMHDDEEKKLEFNIEIYKWGTDECVYSSKKMTFSVWYQFNFFSSDKFEVRSQQCEI